MNDTGYVSKPKRAGPQYEINWAGTVVYNRQHTGSERDIGNLYINTGYKNEGSAVIKANYTAGPITIFTDVQYRYTTFNYTGIVALSQRRWHFINPKAVLSVGIGPRALVYYSVGSTGREPTRNDLFGGNDDLPTDSLGNPLLFITTPEYVTDYELGFRNQSPKLDFNLNACYLSFQNEIVLNGQFVPNGLTLTNAVAQSRRMGLELNATYQPSKNVTLIHNASLNYRHISE